MPVEIIDGELRYTQYDNLAEVVRRPVMLPLYHFCGLPYPYSVIENQPYNRWGNRYEGRVLVGDAGHGEDIRMQDEYRDHVGPTDVVTVRLYEGDARDGHRGPGLSAKVPAYEENKALLKEIAPRVKGIMLGNCGAELAAHQWLPENRDAEARQQNRETIVDWLVDFIHKTGDLIKEFGGQPYWGPMDRDVAIDCYHGDCRMAEAVKEYDGVMIIFQEGAFFPRWHCIYGNDGQDGRMYEAAERKTEDLVQINHIENPHSPGYTNWEARAVEWDAREPYPYRKLLEYFRKYRIWHCIGYDRHIAAGYDRLLQLHGVEALVY